MHASKWKSRSGKAILHYYNSMTFQKDKALGTVERPVASGRGQGEGERRGSLGTTSLCRHHGGDTCLSPTVKTYGTRDTERPCCILQTPGDMTRPGRFPHLGERLGGEAARWGRQTCGSRLSELNFAVSLNLIQK